MGSKDSDIAGEVDGGDRTQSAGIYKWHHGGNWIVKEPVAAASNGKARPSQCMEKSLGFAVETACHPVAFFLIKTGRSVN